MAETRAARVFERSEFRAAAPVTARLSERSAAERVRAVTPRRGGPQRSEDRTRAAPERREAGAEAGGECNAPPPAGAARRP